MRPEAVERADPPRATLATNIETSAAYGRVGYVYGYPHKKAYRPLSEPRRLADVWAGEDRRYPYSSAALPSRNHRRPFCNSSTSVPPNGSPAQAYLDALAREMDACAQALTPFRFARLYLGGGTPTYLTTSEIRRLVDQLRRK